MAKFRLQDVEDIVKEGQNRLFLLVNSEEVGSDIIQVISGGVKKGK